MKTTPKTTTTRSTKEPAMKKTIEKKSAPKTTIKPADKQGAKKAAQAVEQPAVDDFTAAAGITSAAAIATSDNQVDTAPVASDAPVDAPAEEPAPMAAANTDDTPVANTDAPDATPAEQPAAEGAATDASITSDARDMILARLRTLEPAAQRVMLEGYSKQELHQLVERATGTKTSGRLSPKAAVERILAALNPEAPKADAQPAKDEQTEREQQVASTRGRAAELPAVGTVLANVDRHGKVRATCTVVEAGVEYAGKTYTSLSAAAIIASRDLGNTTKQTSGPRFWGLLAGAPRTPKAAQGLDLDVIGRAWERYRERAEAATKVASDDERERLHQLLNGHSSSLLSLTAAVA